MTCELIAKIQFQQFSCTELQRDEQSNIIGTDEITGLTLKRCWQKDNVLAAVSVHASQRIYFLKDMQTSKIEILKEKRSLCILDWAI